MSQSESKAVASPSLEVEPLGEALVFMQVLWAVAHMLESASKRMHAELGITGPQRLVLRIVGHHGRISAGHLADVLHIHPSSLTGMLQRLEQAELLRRESDPFDRRRALFELTRRGMRINAQRKGTIEDRVALALKRTPKDKVTAAKSVLRAIAASLDVEGTLERKALGAGAAPAPSSKPAAQTERPKPAARAGGRRAAGRRNRTR